MVIDAVTVSEGLRLSELAGTRQDEQPRMGASAESAVLAVKTTGAHEEDVPKTRRKWSK